MTTLRLVPPTPESHLDKLGRWILDRGAPGTYEHADYNVWTHAGERLASGFVERWLPEYLASLPVLLVISLGTWGFLSMVNKRLATFGVGFVFIFGGVVLV